MNVETLPLGDRALLINFQQKIDPEVHHQVTGLSEKIEQAGITAITFILPAYCSITIGYHPEEISYRDLSSRIRNLAKKGATAVKTRGRSLTLPVCYHQSMGLDLLDFSRLSGMDPMEVIELHTAQEYLVFMLGFLPGFPYLGPLPEPLQYPRKATPRLRIPARSVGIAGNQTGIYPNESPGGWNIIGNTPIPVFDPNKPDPFLLKAGDRVRFKSISITDYRLLEEKVRNDTFDWHSIYE